VVRICAASLAVLALSLGQTPARPNFSGTWICVSPAECSGQEETIVQDATTLRRSHGSEGDGHHFTYKLDGTESRNSISSHDDEIKMIATATWEGNRLVINESVTYPNGRKRQARQTLSLDEKGQLTMGWVEIVDGREQPEGVAVFKKKAAAAP
jgi:hypothetical protein